MESFKAAFIKYVGAESEKELESMIKYSFEWGDTLAHIDSFQEDSGITFSSLQHACCYSWLSFLRNKDV